MFERFTDCARKVLALANQEAQRFHHEYIGTEHLLLGLVKEGSDVGPTILKNLNVDLHRIRQEVEKCLKMGPDLGPTGKLAQTPRAKKVIKFAIEEARAMQAEEVGTEHLLLGLLRKRNGVAAQVLMRLGVKMEDVREEILNMGIPTTPSAESTPQERVESVLAEVVNVHDLETGLIVKTTFAQTKGTIISTPYGQVVLTPELMACILASVEESCESGSFPVVNPVAAITLYQRLFCDKVNLETLVQVPVTGGNQAAQPVTVATSAPEEKPATKRLSLHGEPGSGHGPYPHC